MTAARTGADLLAESLAANGVSHVFGIPGEHCLGIVDAVSRQPGMRFISVRHESAAAFMAEAYGKLTGRPAACLGTASVGAANLVAGINVAHHDSTPMLALVGQVDTAYAGRQAWQEADLAAMLAPIARSSLEVSRVGQLPQAIARSLARTRAGRPGPAVLAVPVDIQQAVTSDPAVGPVAVGAPGPDPGQISTVVERIRAARTPILLVGGGIRMSGAQDRLLDFVQAVHVPVVTAFRRTDAFPNDSGYYVGSLGLTNPPSVVKTVRDADLVIAVGTRLSEVTTLRYSFPEPGQRLVHIDVDAGMLAAPSVPAELLLVSDAGLALSAMADLCRQRGICGPPRWWTSRREAGPEPTAAGGELIPPDETVREVARCIDGLLPDNAVLTSDAGDFFIDCSAALTITGSRRYLGPTSGSMGYGLPAAMAAKLAQPQSLCVALCGDGGLMMSVPELETAARYGLAVVVVVFNNSSYGSIMRHQRSRYAGRMTGSRLRDVSFAGIAQSLGAVGSVVRTPAEFTESFRRALASAGVSVIDVRLPQPSGKG